MAHFATKRRINKARLLRQLGLLAVPLFIALVVSSPTINQPIEHRWGLNSLFQLRGAVPAPNDVVIVSLNARAAEALSLSQYSHTWPRSIYAKAIERLKEAGAPLIVMDIAFKGKRAADEDAALAKALATHQRVVLFTYLKRHQMQNGVGTVDIEEVFPPAPKFAKEALASGPFVLPKYPARVAFADLFHRKGNTVLASQPLLAFVATLFPETRNLEETTFRVVSAAQSAGSYASFAEQFPTIAAPTYYALRSASPLVINFYGGPQTLSNLPIDNLFSLPLDALTRRVQGKTVYIGYLETQQTEQQDAYLTVYSTTQGLDISGVEISATTYSNLLHGTSLRPTAPSVILLINLAVVILIWLAFRLLPSLNTLAQAVVFSGYFALVYVSFRQLYLWLPLVSVGITALISNAALLLAQYHQHKTQLRKVRYALRQYLPAEAATQVSNSIASLSKQHQLVHGVVLMTDIKGYTTLSENLPPAELHQLMNRYYPLLIDSVKRHGGIVGNIVGDSLLALWTGSEITQTMAEAAFQCAEDIQQKIAGNSQLKRDLPTCIALHGGQFSLGNLGANGHYEYSPVGDIINAASRIEHLNRDLGTCLLLTEDVVSALNYNDITQNSLRNIGAFHLRNKKHAIELFSYTLQDSDLQRTFALALKAFNDKQFGEASAFFNGILNQCEDGPSRYYVNLIAKSNQETLDS